MERNVFIWVGGVILIAFGVDEYHQPVLHNFVPVKVITGCILVLMALGAEIKQKRG